MLNTLKRSLSFFKEARITVSNLDKQVAIRRDVLDGPRALLPAQEPETGLGTMEERILQADPPIKGSTGTECTRSDESARHGQGSFHQDLKTTAIRIRTALSANAGWSSLKRREAARRYIAVYLLSMCCRQARFWSTIATEEVWISYCALHG